MAQGIFSGEQGTHPEALAIHQTPDGQVIVPKSATFIPARLSDNKALMDADPAYMSNLMALPTVERERLLAGNWKIRAAAGLLFKREWVRIIDVAPTDLEIIRGWDFAATPKTDSNDPHSTSSTKIGRTPGGRYVVLHNTNIMEGPAGVERHLKNIASQDGERVQQSIPQDPGAAGKSQVAAQTRALSGYDVRASTETGDKVTRFNPFSAQAQGGNVDVLRGDWNEAWFNALEAFPLPSRARVTTTTPTARPAPFNAFLAPIKGAAYLELARRQLRERDKRLGKEPEIYLALGSVEWTAHQAELKAIADSERRPGEEALAAKRAAETATSVASRVEPDAPPGSKSVPGTIEWAREQAILANARASPTAKRDATHFQQSSGR